MSAQGLTRDEVVALILTPQDKSALIATNVPDPTSIMSYSLPAVVMKDRVAVLGGKNINATDGQFADSIYQKLPGWQLLDNNPATSSIVADSDARYQMYKSGLIWKYTGTPLTGWQLLDNNPATKKTLHNTGKIWKYAGTPITGWQLLDGNPATADIIASGDDLYQLHTTGRIWRYTGTPMTGWQELDNNPTGLIFKYTGVPLTGWLKLGENTATVDIAAGVTGWKQLDNNSAAKEIAVVAGGGGVYQILKTGEIWRYGTPDLAAWKQLDGNAAATSIAIGKWPHQLHKTGLIWRYTATW
ncbi:Peptidase m12 [Fusarium sp. Ph1]|nr:Peptidase m12 [Fusarium sp. Ph1]